MLYPFVLHLHGGLRWVLLLLLGFALVRGVLGTWGRMAFTRWDQAVGIALSGLSHVQFLLGFWMYFFLSPITKLAFERGKDSFRDPLLRYWSLEHMVGMTAFVACMTLARSFSKRAKNHKSRFRWGLLFYVIGACVVLAIMPWSFSKS